MKILLCCSAGMSTSLLVSNMKEAAEKKGINAEIWATSLPKVKDEIEKSDILLLGPQVKYEFEDLKVLTDRSGKKIALINMVDYGRMNGEKVLDETIKILNEEN